MLRLPCVLNLMCSQVSGISMIRDYEYLIVFAHDQADMPTICLRVCHYTLLPQNFTTRWQKHHSDGTKNKNGNGITEDRVIRRYLSEQIPAGNFGNKLVKDNFAVYTHSKVPVTTGISIGTAGDCSKEEVTGDW